MFVIAFFTGRKFPSMIKTMVLTTFKLNLPVAHVILLNGKR